MSREAGNSNVDVFFKLERVQMEISLREYPKDMAVVGKIYTSSSTSKIPINCAGNPTIFQTSPPICRASQSPCVTTKISK